MSLSRKLSVPWPLWAPSHDLGYWAVARPRPSHIPTPCFLLFSLAFLAVQGFLTGGNLYHSCLSYILPSAASKKQTVQLRKQSIILSQHFHFKGFFSKLPLAECFL